MITLNQSCIAQSLSQHKWENRVILLFAPDFQNQQLNKQLDIFKKNKKGLEDRKLIVYQISSDAIKKEGKHLEKNGESTNWMEQFEVDKNKFTFILIGLDGGEKMRSSDFVSNLKLFSKIDQMPMRRAEIRKNKN